MTRRYSAPVKWLLLLVGAVVATGCGANDAMMPLKKDHIWTYRARTVFERHTVPIRVTRAITVDGTSGFELAGPLGVSRIAWKSNRLIAESMVNARFVPPIPLLIPSSDLKDAPRQVASWHGRTYSLGIERPSSATLTEQKETLDLGTRKIQTVLAIVNLRLPTGVLEIKSWYQAGVGLVQQEQRTNGKRIIQLVLVGQSEAKRES